MSRTARAGGWRLALRLARRDAVRNRVRSILALLMIALPVLGVVAADVLIRTADVSGREGLERRIGTEAAAKVMLLGERSRIQQAADPGSWNWVTTEETIPHPATLADVQRVLGARPVTPAPQESGDVLVDTDHGRERALALEVDGRDRLTDGLFRLTLGRWPASRDEVAVNAALTDRGPRIGDTIEATGHDGTVTERRIVGLAESTTNRSDEMVVGLPGSLPLAETSQESWLVGGDPVTWDQVQQLNALGVVVTSRQVVTHPDGIPDPIGNDGSGNETWLAVAALVAAMALVEVVLLAGPAFAVGARKQQRSLALMTASGGTPRQARRVILAGGVVLGLAAAAAGVTLGLGAAWALQPVVQRFSREWLGPFEVPWLHVLAIAVFGFVSAILAAVVPAWIASRQNVVAVLAGRRGDPRPTLRSPIIGALVLGLGVALAYAGAHGRGSYTIAVSALVCVLGMLFLVPAVVALVARTAGRLPLPLRFAARDAARHRTRTTPAVAAVAATVAGVVALGIGVSSDEAENRATYEPLLALGDATVRPDLSFTGGSRPDFDSYRAVVADRAPAATVSTVRGVPQESGYSEGWTGVTFRAPGRAGTAEGPEDAGGSEDPGDSDDADVSPATWASALGTDVVVSDGELPPVVTDSPGFDRATASRALAAGKAVVLSSEPSTERLTAVDVRVDRFDGVSGEPVATQVTRVPAQVLYVRPEVPAPLLAVLPSALARKAHVPTGIVELQLAHPDLSREQEKDLTAALGALAVPGSVYVERGYQTDQATAIIQWVLAGLGAVLMLGGTLTATFLALSDARPDLATLAAVGAAPRTRRGVGAAYALVVGLVGAALGALVGAVPGVAVTYPLTVRSGETCVVTAPGGGCTAFGSSGPFLDVPWLLIGVVVVGLPVATALVVGLCTRSRLPMAARLS